MPPEVAPPARAGAPRRGPNNRFPGRPRQARGLRGRRSQSSLAARRTAASLDIVGRHPVRSRRSRAKAIVRTSPDHPRPIPEPPVHAYTTLPKPSSPQIASAIARTEIASPLPRLPTAHGAPAAAPPARIPATTSSTWTYDFEVPGSAPMISSLLGSFPSLRPRAWTTPWWLRPPITFARRNTMAWTPNGGADADRRASRRRGTRRTRGARGDGGPRGGRPAS